MQQYGLDGDSRKAAANLRTSLIVGREGRVPQQIPAAVERNRESLQDLADNLSELGYDLQSFPFVIQYNKRDLPAIASVEELRTLLNPQGVPDIEASARTGLGVIETLRAISKMVLKQVKESMGSRAETSE